MEHIFCLSNSILPHPHKSETLVFLKPRFHQLSIRASLTPNPTQLTSEHPDPLIVEHLIKEFGVPTDRAVSVSTAFSRSTTLSSLTSVPDFLKQNGFSDTHIRNVISKKPRLLCSRIDETLKRKLQVLEEQLGLSPSSVAEFIAHHPYLLCLSVDNQIIPVINLLRSLLLSNEEIVKVINRNRWLITNRAILHRVSTNTNLLRQSGVLDSRIKYFVLHQHRILCVKTDYFQDVFDRVEKLGVKRNSPNFIHALGAVGGVSKSNLETKFELYRGYGWSESDILTAFSSFPVFITVSEEKVRKVMSFLVDELKYESKDIPQMAKLFKYSLETRLRPRLKVMNILYSRGLLNKKLKILTIANISEEKFWEDYVVRFIDRAPDVEGAYLHDFSNVRKNGIALDGVF